VAKRVWIQYTKNGVGVDGLSVTLDYHDEAANWTTGAGVTPGGRAGFYYADITPDAAGSWGGTPTTAGDVDQKEPGFEFEVQEAGWTVAGIAAAVVTALEAMLASAVTTTNGFFKQIKDALNATVSSRATPSDVTTALSTTASTVATNLDAKVSDRATPAQTATSILDALTSAHTVPGSIGVAITNAGSAADPLTNPVPGTYLPGTAGYRLGLLGSGVVLTTSPLSPNGSVLTMVRGDSHVAAEWSWQSSGWPDLTAATLVMTFRNKITDALLFAVTPTVVTPVGPPAVVASPAFSVVQTSVLPLPGSAFPNESTVKWDIEARWAGNVRKTLVRGVVIVQEDESR